MERDNGGEGSGKEGGREEVGREEVGAREGGKVRAVGTGQAIQAMV